MEFLNTQNDIEFKTAYKHTLSQHCYFWVFRYQLLGEINYRECDADGWTNDIPICEGRHKMYLQVY